MTKRPTSPGRLGEEKSMSDTAKTQEQMNQFAGKAVEAMTLWADVNQRVLREMTELAAGTAKEGVRLYAELQQGAIDAMRDSHAVTLRWQESWQHGAKDPVLWYQKALAEGVETTQKLFRYVEGNVQAVARSAERLQASTEKSGKEIQETVGALATKMKDVYAQN
ncbi:MAG TPA: hypothetical protein VGL09_12840 [Methylomirabilota bacterium]|jgi:head-tail adaptor